MNKSLLSTLILLGLAPVFSQAEEAPAHNIPGDARDPHQYSNGFTRHSGPYVLHGTHPLMLADEHKLWSVLADRLEYEPDDERGAFDISAWYGTTFNRLQINLEGELADGNLEHSQTDLLWNHGISTFHDTLLGVRLDSQHEGAERQWLAAGVQGLLPYWIEYRLMGYVGDDSRSAISLSLEHELLFTQRLGLASRVETSAYGKDDAETGTGSGFSDLSAGIRLRYDLSRRFGPYAGIDWSKSFGTTARYLREADEPVTDTHYLLGLRFWF
ncbi:copper resistance protein B [Thalassolituus sp. LLYu03]|uniref:copper resistance protein B n=1 Tax=Thalassolituus sp. LLYu03 TaxID=3421656 RepID=UPI003D2E06DE